MIGSRSGAAVAIALALLVIAPAAAGLNGRPTEMPAQDLVDARIDPYVGTGRGWKEMPWDPQGWSTVSQVAVKGAPYGVEEASVKIRMEGIGDPPHRRIPLQVALAIENSTVVSAEDPNTMRCDAVRYFADQVTVPDEIGHLSFNETTSLGSPLTTDYQGAKSTLRCSPSGGSNISGALELALDTLVAGRKPDTIPAVVLLTTGCYSAGGDPHPQVSRAINENIKVFTIGLYSDANSSAKRKCETQMMGWAQLTGGKYYWLQSPSDLQQVYKDLANSVTGNDIAGWAPSSGLPMIRFKMGEDVEVVPGSFTCNSYQCHHPTPDIPSRIEPDNRGLDLAWTAPVGTVKIQRFWQIEFQVRSYKIGLVPLNDPDISRIRYETWNRTGEVTVPLPALHLLGTVPTPPVVASTYPVGNATEVPLDATIVVSFNQEMDADTTIGSITVSPQVDGGIPSVWGHQLAWSHLSDFADDTVYWVTISTGAKTAAGVPLAKDHSFVFHTGDGEPNQPVRPTVVETRPIRGSTQVPVSASVVVLFDQQMDPESAVQALRVSPDADGAAATVVGNQLAYTHSGWFKPWTEHTVTVAMTAKNRAGVSMGSTYTFTFRTGGAPEEPELRPPEVTFDPLPGTVDVPVVRVVTLRFTEPMDRASVGGALRVAPVAPVELRWSNLDRELELTPTEDWAPGTSYVVALNRSASSAAGAPMLGDASTVFTTAGPRPSVPEPDSGESTIWALRLIALLVIGLCAATVLVRYRRMQAEEARRARLPTAPAKTEEEAPGERIPPLEPPSTAATAKRIALRRTARRAARSRG